MHYNYICKTLFHYNEDRLPKKLTKILINKNLFCIKYLKDILIEFNIAMDMSSINKNDWEINLAKLLEETKIKEKQVRTNIGLDDTLIPSSVIYLIYMGDTGPCDLIMIIFGYHVNR